MTTKLPCIYCGKLKRPAKNAVVIQCSDCRKAKDKEKAKDRKRKECEVCGNEFFRMARQDDAARACSRECGATLLSRDADEKWKEMRIAKANAAASALVGSLRPCSVCGIGVAGRRACGECQTEHNKREAKAKAAGFANYSEWLNATCVDCNKAPRMVKADGYSLRRCEHCNKQWKREQRKIRKMKSDKRTSVMDGAGVVTVRKLRFLIAMARGKCRLCGLLMSSKCDVNHDRHVEIDHKKPRSLGGSNAVSNLQPICRKCNGLKGAFTAVDVLLIPTARS